MLFCLCCIQLCWCILYFMRACVLLCICMYSAAYMVLCMLHTLAHECMKKYSCVLFMNILLAFMIMCVQVRIQGFLFALRVITGEMSWSEGRANYNRGAEASGTANKASAAASVEQRSITPPPHGGRLHHKTTGGECLRQTDSLLYQISIIHTCTHSGTCVIQDSVWWEIEIT